MTRHNEKKNAFWALFSSFVLQSFYLSGNGCRNLLEILDMRFFSTASKFNLLNGVGRKRTVSIVPQVLYEKKPEKLLLEVVQVRPDAELPELNTSSADIMKCGRDRSDDGASSSLET